MERAHARWWIAGLGCALAVGCEGGAGPAEVPAASRARGMTLPDWTPSGYQGPGCSAALDAIAASGAGSVALVVTWYQADPRDSIVSAHPGRTPTDLALSVAALGARRRGLSLLVKPHVDVLDGTWRAEIRPGLPPAWFASYRTLLLPLAELAEGWGAERLAVGTELAGTLEQEAEWRGLIADVRRVYSGEIVYAASWDEAGIVPFWDAVDRIGVNAYFPVATRRDPTRVDLLVAWQVWLERLDRLARRTGRPVLFTEIGYRSVDGAGMDPFRDDGDAREDPGEQADLYWAALQATHGEPWFAGAYWWDWRVDGSGGPGNRGYTPAGKPAAEVLAAFWGAE